MNLIKIDFNSIKPLYIQIAEAIEYDIIQDILKEGEDSYSQLNISKELNVNPATAAKGINVLVQKGILKKQRGLSMIVAPGAKKRLVEEKKNKDIRNLAEKLVRDAKSIGMTNEAIIKLINDIFDERGRNDENE